MQKISKSDQPPGQIDKDREQLLGLLARKSQHFEPGTFVMFDGERYRVRGYLNDEMVLGNEYRTIAVKAYSTQWRKNDCSL